MSECLHVNSKVLATRRKGADLYRRRECPDCGVKFVSLEQAPKGLKMPPELDRKKPKKKAQPKPTPPLCPMTEAAWWSPINAGRH